MTRTLARLTVLGAGVLGGQIAWHSSFRGKSVSLYEPAAQARDRAGAAFDTYAQIYRTQFGADDAMLAAARARLAVCSDLETAVAGADLVIESVPEVPDIKARAYRDMAGLLQPHTIVATNSSTLLPREFAEATGRPDRYCALHFANLIWAMNVVEIMAHPRTSRATLEAAAQFVIDIGQVPVAVARESNGYVLNGWLVPLLTASLALVADGVATPDDVDRTYMIVNRGCAMGPCGIADVIGMKTVFDVSMYWGTVRQDAQMLKIAAYVRERFLDRGLQGALGGEGFYRYPDPAYARRDFLDVPDASAVAAIAERALLR